MSQKMFHLALFQPDIPQNLGAIMRLCACMNTSLHIIEPCGFPFNERKIKRAAMDYIDHLSWRRHDNWDAFVQWCEDHNKEILLMTTKGAQAYTEFSFTPENQVLLAGSESNGAPDYVHERADKRLFIPMHGQTRSLNIGMACAMFLAEVQRQYLAQP